MSHFYLENDTEISDKAKNPEQENLEIPRQIYWNNPSYTSLWSLSDLLQGEIMQIVKNDKTNSKTLSGK